MSMRAVRYLADWSWCARVVAAFAWLGRRHEQQLARAARAGPAEDLQRGVRGRIWDAESGGRGRWCLARDERKHGRVLQRSRGEPREGGGGLGAGGREKWSSGGAGQGEQRPAALGGAVCADRCR
jgi:hypothetical protein